VLCLAACGMASGRPQHARDRPAAFHAPAANVPDGDWSRFNFTAARSGVGPASTGITAKNLGSLGRRTVSLPGTVDSSAIQLAGVMVGGHRRDVLFVTTSYGRTLAVNAQTGARLWQFTPAGISSYEGSSQITTATPVADPDRRFIYTASPDGLIHKLSIANGHRVWATRVTLDPTHEKIASALNISGDSVLVTTGGYIGDAPPYQGHVVELNRTNGHRTAVWNSLCSHRRALIHPSSCPASDSAIWGRAGAVVVPGSRRILVATGNGPFDGSSNWGDSMIELSPTLQPLAHWTPGNQQELNNSDTDLGSTSPAVLPGGLAVQGGKAGKLSLLRLSTLSAMTGAGGQHLGGAVQNIVTPGGNEMFTAPVVWQHAHRTWLFVSTDGDTWGYVLGSNHRLSVAWRDSMAGTSPVLAGGLLYVFDQFASRLDVLSPTTGHALHSFPAAGGHWNSPIVVGGRIILPVGNANDHNTTGQMFIYHVPGR
jgi:PQQ-like domain